ncbi:unnamed protein product [Leuciscus chuanchicus]
MRVGFGKLASMSFKDLYEAVDRDRKGFTKWVRKQESRPGTKMDALQVYIRRRDAERMASPHPGMNLTYLHLFVFGFRLVIQLT